MDHKLIILNALKAGANNATTRTELVTITGLSDRAVRATIRELRRESYPILSNTEKGGYYYPDSVDKAIQFGFNLKHRGVDLIKSGNTIIRWANDNPSKFEQTKLVI